MSPDEIFSRINNYGEHDINGMYLTLDEVEALSEELAMETENSR